jgi:hypothetical protein
MGYPSYTNRKASYKTTTAAIIALLICLGSAVLTLMDDDPATNPDYGALAAAATAASGLLFARDVDVTSEQAGAK